MVIVIKDKSGTVRKKVSFGAFIYGDGLTKHEKAVLNNKLPPDIIRIYPDKFAMSVACSEKFALVVYEKDGANLRFSNSEEDLNSILNNMKPFKAKISGSNRETKYGNRYFFNTDLYGIYGEGLFHLLSADDGFMKIGGNAYPRK